MKEVMLHLMNIYYKLNPAIFNQPGLFLVLYISFAYENGSAE